MQAPESSPTAASGAVPGSPAGYPAFRPLDLVVLGLIVGAGFAVLPWLASPFGTRAEVWSADRNVARLDLAGEARRMRVDTDIGPLELLYGRGQVRVASAPCPNQICVRSGPVGRRGATLTCLPGRVRIVVEGRPDRGEEVDGVSY